MKEDLVYHRIHNQSLEVSLKISTNCLHSTDELQIKRNSKLDDTS